MRVSEIESALHEVTGHPTRVKIAADIGPVYLLEFEGHDVLDPQGTPVDRCARIAKYGKPGTVVASREFASAVPLAKWFVAGTASLKGLGPTEVHQLGEKSITVKDLVEVDPAEFQSLKAQLAAVSAERDAALNQFEAARAEMKKAGKKPPPSLTDDTSEKIKKKIDELVKVIEGAGRASSTDYARFLFLHWRSEGQAYDKYRRTFDGCIEANLVSNQEGDYYVLNESNKRNKLALGLMRELSDLLEEVEDDDPNELFDYRLDDAEYWSKKIGYNVK
jgi:hypothetical protein